MMTRNGEVYLPDSSAVVEGIVKELIERRRIKGDIIVHFLLVEHFRKLAKEGDSLGHIGLKEIENIRKSAEKFSDVRVLFTSEVPETFQVMKTEDIDALLCELARELNAILITSDDVQRRTAQALGVRVLFYLNKSEIKLSIEEFFDEETMSIHLKEGVVPYAKKGRPGSWRFVPLRKTPITRDELQNMIREVLEACRRLPNAYVDTEHPYSTLIQLGPYRIVITRPPLSDGLELTAVRPIVKLSLEDYGLPEKLIRRLEERAEGILIAGAPGMGKTTFAQALAEFYLRKGKIVKTIESPRDLQLPPEITQYSKAKSSPGEIHDVLLLSRPDYTVFDEMRTLEDFKLYADLRLAGVGMIGVVHATSPIDAIQRFVGKVELGMIPSIVDTVIFIKDGKIAKVYELEMVVKIPHGLREADLARPVVVVKDFLTGEPEYEMYVFGERTFVVPVKRRITEYEVKTRKAIERTLKKFIPDSEFEIEVTSEGRALIHVSPEYIPLLGGKFRKRLERVSRRLGIEIEIVPMT